MAFLLYFLHILLLLLYDCDKKINCDTNIRTSCLRTSKRLLSELIMHNATRSISVLALSTSRCYRYAVKLCLKIKVSDVYSLLWTEKDMLFFNSDWQGIFIW
jgi:hypothetical protein